MGGVLVADTSLYQQSIGHSIDLICERIDKALISAADLVLFRA
jgi:hypothetical protein